MKRKVYRWRITCSGCDYSTETITRADADRLIEVHSGRDQRDGTQHVVTRTELHPRVGLTPQQRWVVAFIKKHGHPYSDWDSAAIHNIFTEFFTAHDEHFNAAAWHDACDAADEAACARWDRERGR